MLIKDNSGEYLSQLNEDYYEDDDFFDSVEDTTDDEEINIEPVYDFRTGSRVCFICEVGYDVKKYEDCPLNIKRYLYVLNGIFQQQLRTFDTQSDMECMICAGKDREQYDYTVLSRKHMVAPRNVVIDYQNLSDSKINAIIDEEIYRYVDGYEPKWRDADDTDNYGMLLTFFLTVKGEWEDMGFYKFLADMKKIVKALKQFNTRINTIRTKQLSYEKPTSFRYYDKDNHIRAEFGKALPLSEWTPLTYIRMYADIFGKSRAEVEDELKADDKKIEQQIKHISLDSAFYKWHQIYFLPDAQSDYDYYPYGYAIENQYRNEYNLYCHIGKKNPDKWTYENINQWLEDKFINRLSQADELSLLKSSDIATINIYVSIAKGTDGIPPRSDKKKLYVWEVNRQVTARKSILYKFIYTDGNFSRFNTPSRGRYNISNNSIKAGKAFSEYKDDIKHGLYGRGDIIHKMPEFFYKYDDEYEAKKQAALAAKLAQADKDK